MKCRKHGHTETCLLSDGYPVTKKGKLSCKRVRAAAAYGKRFGVIKRLKRGGLCKYVRKCRIESKFCS